MIPSLRSGKLRHGGQRSRDMNPGVRVGSRPEA